MLAKLAVYRVKQCGYYRIGKNNLVCSDSTKVLGDIDQWIRNQKPIIEKTRTFEADKDGKYLPVYCFDLGRNRKNDFLLTTWNQTPDDDGVVAAVAGGDVAGGAHVNTRSFPNGSIPGYGTHFWFLPADGRLATVRFESQPLNGHDGLNRFMQGYLERFSPHVRFGEDSDDGNIFKRNIIGYATDNVAAEADHRLHPRFRSVLLRREGELAYIRKNRSKIKRVIRKSRPSKGGAATRTILDRMVVFLGGSPQGRSLPDSMFTFEIPYTPTEAELKDIIEKYDPAESHETWDDVGFDIQGDSTRRWLSNSTLKLEINLDDGLRDGPGSLADANALLRALEPYRAQILA